MMLNISHSRVEEPILSVLVNRVFASSLIHCEPIFLSPMRSMLFITQVNATFINFAMWYIY